MELIWSFLVGIYMGEIFWVHVWGDNNLLFKN